MERKVKINVLNQNWDDLWFYQGEQRKVIDDDGKSSAVVGLQAQLEWI